MATFNKIVSGVTQLNSQLREDQSSLSRCANRWHVHEERAAQMVGATETGDTTGAAILGEFVNCLIEERGDVLSIPHLTVRQHKD